LKIFFIFLPFHKLGRSKTTASPSEFTASGLKAWKGREDAFITLAITGRHWDKFMRSEEQRTGMKVK